MYCKKCGTYIDGEETLCPACQAQEDFNNTTVVDVTPVYTEEAKSKDRRAGLAGAIVSAVLGVLGFIFAYIGLIFAGYLPIVTIVFIITAIPLSIVALVKGISSIKLFKRHCKEGKAKPIATLIVGIGGVVWAALDLYFIFLTFFIVLIALSML